MTGWTTHTGAAVALPLANIDTDQLIPARFMSTPRSKGYGGYLLHDLRRGADGAPLPDFPLNRHPQTSILFVGPNFGSGSSREAAVYALADAGVRAVVAPSFGEIFAGNAVNNGLLPAKVSEHDTAAAMRLLAGGTLPATVDLSERRISLQGLDLAFDLNEAWRIKLTNGWDDIDLTAQHQDDIAAFRTELMRHSPWRFAKT